MFLLHKLFLVGFHRYYSAYMYSYYKKKRKVLNVFFFGGGGIKYIDFQDYSISVTLPLNKDLFNRVSSKI